MEPDKFGIRFNLPREKKIQSILKGKRDLIHDPYLDLSHKKAFQLALRISDFMLQIKRKKYGK